MTQGILSFNYIAEKVNTGATALGGLPVYLDMIKKSGLSASVDKYLKVRENSQGWSDSQVVNALLLLNLTGGSCVEDLKVLETDKGLRHILLDIELQNLPRKQRRKIKRRWEKDNKRAVPSPSAVFRYLSAFHDSKQEELRRAGKAFIPAPNNHLQGFSKVNADFLAFVQANTREITATLDMDATIKATNKKDAKFCYQGMKSYQPINTWWAELGMILHTEFRDGNVPAGFEQLRVLKEALALLPSSVKTVRLRSDTAGYQHDLLKYCAEENNKHFGKIEFAVGCNVDNEFKLSVKQIPELEWKPLYKTIKGKKVKTATEWAEVCFVPNKLAKSKKMPQYRYLAKRTALSDQLSFANSDQAAPFQVLEMKNTSYKIFGIVTNMDWEGEKLIHWHHERCGKSEEAHSIMKEDLAGGKFPSGDFGENAAWWWIMILALNLNAAMKSLALGRGWVTKRMKAIRFALINIPGRVMERSRRLWVCVCEAHPSFELLHKARSKILSLIPAPG